MLKRRSKTAADSSPRPMAPSGDHEQREMMEARLAEAVDRGAFHLLYQPLVRLDDGEIIGWEALLRWNADVGPVTTGEFIPLLEETGLIVAAGEWVLAEACQFATTWDEASGWLLIVNVAAEQLRDGFSRRVLDILGESGFPPGRLCLDLTSPARLPDPAAAWSDLRQLKAEGTRLFLDDFGMAGSSIVDLKNFALDGVKIHSSFVAGMGVQVDDDTIVAAIVNLAHALGMQAIAEGVESAEQLEQLLDLGCDLGQGYHFARPQAPGDLQLGAPE